jgi:beta-glucosidase
LDNSRKTLVNATSFYQGQWYGNMSVVVSPTNAGYIEGGLRNRQCANMLSERSRSEGPVVMCDDSPSVGWHKVTLIMDSTGPGANSELSFRFAYSRTNGDIADAAAAAEGKALALVFVDDQGRNIVPNKQKLSSLNPEQLKLIQAVAAKNPNTVVVINTGTPFIVKEWVNDVNVKAVLNMWQSGQEGGTATARLLLGLANPSGHTTMTWPIENTDTVYGYNQPSALYPGDTSGVHPERLKGVSKDSSNETQGIYSGYRYYDQMNLPVQFPFGLGLSYTSFKFSALKLKPSKNGNLTVDFDLTNTGSVPGAAVPQVYVGPGRAVPGIQQAVRSLRGFDRVYLEPGQTKHVTILLDERSFQYWSERGQQWITNLGRRTIFVGDADSIKHLPLSASVMIVKTGSVAALRQRR